MTNGTRFLDWLLVRKKTHELPDLFGIDYDDVLLDWMEGYPRNEELDFLKSSIKRALDMGNEQLVLMRKNELVELLHSEKKAEQMIAKWKNE